MRNLMRLFLWFDHLGAGVSASCSCYWSSSLSLPWLVGGYWGGFWWILLGGFCLCIITNQSRAFDGILLYWVFFLFGELNHCS